MYKENKILAIIPARGGSKGLPGKNIKDFAGKPLISWTINAAKKSKYMDKVIVSTDSREIAGISEKYGAEIPFLRPENISTDTASSIDAVIHAVSFLKDKNDGFDILIVLQPTSPLRAPTDIDGAVEALFEKKGARAVVSVTEAVSSPLWTGELPPDGCLKDFLRPGLVNKNRQDLPAYFQLNGAIFLGFTDHVIKNKGFYGDHSFAYVMPKERSIDIDDILDFKFAETVFKETVGTD